MHSPHTHMFAMHEVRYPDPAANPDLGFAAMLMAGLDGIQNKIESNAFSRRLLLYLRHTPKRYRGEGRWANLPSSRRPGRHSSTRRPAVAGPSTGTAHLHLHPQVPTLPSVTTRSPIRKQIRHHRRRVIRWYRARKCAEQRTSYDR
jgi:hypothetical protein